MVSFPLRLKKRLDARWFVRASGGLTREGSLGDLLLVIDENKELEPVDTVSDKYLTGSECEVCK